MLPSLKDLTETEQWQRIYDGFCLARGKNFSNEETTPHFRCGLYGNTVTCDHSAKACTNPVRYFYEGGRLGGLRYFLREHVFTQDKETSEILHFSLYPFLDEIIETKIQEKPLVIDKARQMLVSWTFCGYAVWDCLVESPKEHLMFSKAQRESNILIERVQFIWERLRWFNFMFNVLSDAKSQFEIELKPAYKVDLGLDWTKCKIVSLPPGTGDIGRAFSPSHALLDEAAFIPNARRLYTSVTSSMMRKGNISIVSTQDDAFGFFWDMTQSTDTKVVRIPWHIHPERNEEWAERTRREKKLTQMEWNRDYECKAQATIGRIYGEYSPDRHNYDWDELFGDRVKWREIIKGYNKLKNLSIEIAGMHENRITPEADFEKWFDKIYEASDNLFSRYIQLAIKKFAIGVDFGYFDPFCCLWAIETADRKVLLLAEHYESGKLLKYHAVEIWCWTIVLLRAFNIRLKKIRDDGDRFSDFELLDLSQNDIEFGGYAGGSEAQLRNELAKFAINVEIKTGNKKRRIRSINEKIFNATPARIGIGQQCMSFLLELLNYIKKTDALPKDGDHAMDAFLYLVDGMVLSNFSDIVIESVSKASASKAGRGK